MNELDTSVAVTAAIKAERARCLQLFDMSMPGYDDEIMAAIRDGSSVETTAHRIMLAMRGRGVDLRTLQADASPAVPFAAAAEPGGARGGLKRAAARIAKQESGR